MPQPPKDDPEHPSNKPKPGDPGYEGPGKGLGREGAPGQQKPKPDPDAPHPDQTLPGDLDDETEGEEDDEDEDETPRGPAGTPV